MNRIEAAEKALTLSLKHGCKSARILLGNSTHNYYSVRDNQLEKLQQATESAINIQLFIDDRYGSFSTNRINEEEISLLVRKGIETTICLSPDKCRQLPDSSLYYRGGGEDLSQLDSSFDSIGSSDKIKIAIDTSAEIYGTDPKIISVTSDYCDSKESSLILDSNGFNSESFQSYFSISAECSVSGKKDSKPNSSWHESAIFFQNLKKVGIGRCALSRALAKIDPKKLRSGKYSTIIDNTVATRLISPIITALNGASIQQNNSFLIDKIGKQIFSNKFSLLDMPHKRGCFGARYFDSEGIATLPRTIIDKGVVNTYFINTYHSKKLNMPTTIGSPSVIAFLTEKELSQKEMLRSLDSGILVTGFNGGNSNSTTGDFSYGVEGFYFENGEICYPIKEMIMTGNLITLWNQLLLVGTDIKEMGKWLSPSIAFSNVIFNGI